MSTPLEFDLEMREGQAALNVAAGLYSSALSDAIAAARHTAALVTDGEMARWRVAAEKLWLNQSALTARHGARPSHLRQSWLGNAAGLGVPLLVFGGSLFENGFVLPVFWALAVAADIGGRAACLRMAPMELAPRPASPAEAETAAAATIAACRLSGDWADAPRQIEALIQVDTAINLQDTAMRHGAHTGKRVGTASAAVLILGLIAAHTVVPDALTPWTVLLTTLIATFGLGCWLTAIAYAGAVEQPPYPVHGSAERIQRHVSYESALARVGDAQFSNRETVIAHTTEEMRKKRNLIKALRNVERSERVLEDARWHVAILKADRQVSNNFRP